MMVQVHAWRVWIGLGLAIAAFTPALPGQSVEPGGAAMVLSPEAPARLVLDYWPSGGWRVGQSGRQVEVDLPGVGHAISADELTLPFGDGAITTFSSEINEGTATLFFGLGCECTLAVQGDGERLRFDVIGTGRIVDTSYRDSAWAPRLAPIPVARHPSEEGEGDAPAQIDSQRVEETRNRLLKELRRAAESGLVTLRPGAGGLFEQSGTGGETQVVETVIDTPAGEQADAPNNETNTETATEPSNQPTVVPATGFTGEVATMLAGEAGSGGMSDNDPGASVFRAAESEAPVHVGGAAPDGLTSPRPLSDPVPPVKRALPTPRVSAKWWRDTIAASPAQACFANEAFRLTDPLPPPTLIAEISRLRRALVGEFDRADIGAAVLLSRLYIAHGMGVEAVGILAEFAPDAPEVGLLSALAWLVEGRALPDPNILSVSGCNGQHALWQGMNAALAERPAEAIDLEAAAIGALEQTARGLRGQVAVRLGLAAAAEGDWIAAYRLKAMAKRAIANDDRPGQDLLLLLEARIELGRGNSPIALARLKALRGARSPAGAEALFMLAGIVADPSISADVSVEDLRIDLGVLATMQRDTPLGERAFLSEARLTGYLFGRELAFELLAYGVAGRVISEAAYRDALVAVEASLSARPGNGDTPLALIFEADPGRFAGALDTAGFRFALARSYLDLGAPALAEAVLTPADMQSELLLGELSRNYLYISDVEAADRLAARLPEGPERAAVAADVALTSGNAADALVALTAAGAPASRRARAAWNAGEWQASATALAEAISPSKSEFESNAGPGREGKNGLVSPEDPPPRLSLAIRLTLAASRAGNAITPPEALTLVESVGKPDLTVGLQAMFAPLPQGLTDTSPATVAAYLEAVSAEARLIEEILGDG